MTNPSQTGQNTIDNVRGDIALMRVEVGSMSARISALEVAEQASRSTWSKTMLAVVLTLALPAIGVIYQAGILRSAIDEQSRTLSEIRASIAHIADHETRLRLLEEPHRAP